MFDSQRVHFLKCHPSYFALVCTGAKKSEVRINDRDYAKGDIIVLNSWADGHYRGESCLLYIDHVFEIDKFFNLSTDLVSLSVSVLTKRFDYNLFKDAF